MARFHLHRSLTIFSAVFALLALLSGCFGGAGNSTGDTGVAFASPQSFAVGQNPSAIGTTDFNGDGKPDLVVANTGSNTVTVLYNTTVASPSPSPSPVASVSSSPGASPSVTPVPIASPSATPSPTTLSFSNNYDFNVGSGPVSVAVVDVNADGLVDIVTGNSDGTVSVLESTTQTSATQPTFDPVESFQVGQRAETENVVVVDVNGDGKPDIIAANNLDNSVSVMLNTTVQGGTPTFNGPYTFGVGGGPNQVAVQDVNQDGFPDIVTANSDGTVSVLLGSTVANATVPTFQTVQSFTLGAGGVSLVIQDVNGDGLPDLCVALSNGQTAILLNQTNVTASGTVSGNLFSPSPSPTARTSPSPSPSPSPLGSPGLTAASSSLSFMTPSLVPMNATPSWLGGGGISVGGSSDIVTADASGNNCSVQVDQSSGTTVTYANGGLWNAGTDPVFVLPVDVSGSGRLDLVVANNSVNQISVLVNISSPPPAGTASSPGLSTTNTTTTTNTTSTTSSTTTNSTSTNGSTNSGF